MHLCWQEALYVQLRCSLRKPSFAVSQKLCRYGLQAAIGRHSCGGIAQPTCGGMGRTGGSTMPAINLPAIRPTRPAGNRGRIVGRKRPLLPKHVWAIRASCSMFGARRSAERDDGVVRLQNTKVCCAFCLQPVELRACDFESWASSVVIKGVQTPHATT